MMNRQTLSDPDRIEEYKEIHNQHRNPNFLGYPEAAQNNPDSVAAAVMHILYELQTRWEDRIVEPDKGHFGKDNPGIFVDGHVNSETLSTSEQKEICKEFNLVRTNNYRFFTLEEFVDADDNRWDPV